MVRMQDERFSYVVLRRGGRKVGASQAISRHSSDAAEMHDPQPYVDAAAALLEEERGPLPARARPGESHGRCELTGPCSRAVMSQAMERTCHCVPLTRFQLLALA